MPGLIWTPIALLAAKYGFKEKGFMDVVEFLHGRGLAHFDWTNGAVFLPQEFTWIWKYAPDHVHITRVRLVGLLRETKVYDSMLQCLQEHMTRVGDERYDISRL